MKIRHKARLDRTQPALVVKHGNSDKKYLPLEKPGTTLGRARGCDIELDAPEVSSLHCLITRGPDGLHLRDCTSRVGTHVNGQRIQESSLHDGDVLQIGPFSFDLYVPEITWSAVPAASAAPALADAGSQRLQRLERSRRRLAHLALKMRRRLRQNPPGEKLQKLDKALAARQADLDRQAEALRERVRDHRQKTADLQKTEHQLAADRDRLTQESAALKARVQEFEQAQAQRQAQVEAEIQARLKACEERCRDMERAQMERVKPAKTQRAGANQSSPAPAELHLRNRQQDLDAYAQRLQEKERQLQEQEERLKLAQQHWIEPLSVLPGELAEKLGDDNDPLSQQAAVSAYLSRQQVSIIQTEAALNEKCQELSRLMDEFRHWQQETRNQQHAELDVLRQTTSDLSQLLGTRPREPAADTPHSLASPRGHGPHAEKLQAEVTALREQLHQKETQIHKLRQEKLQAARPGERDAEFGKYETELNEFRRQLEADRKTVDEETRQLQERKTELDQAVREAELDLSRERARLSQERAYLDRLREDLRAELDKPQRDPSVQERLAAFTSRRPS